MVREGELDYASEGKAYFGRILFAEDVLARHRISSQQLEIRPGALSVLAYLVSTHDGILATHTEPQGTSLGKITEALRTSGSHVERWVEELVGKRYARTEISKNGTRETLVRPTDEGIGQYHALLVKRD